MRYLFLPVICIYFSLNCLAQPSNDECINAIAVTPQVFGTSCVSTTAASTINATASAFAPSCTGSQADDDIWYSFVANSFSAVVRINNALLNGGGNAIVSMAVYESACPASSASIACFNNIASGNGWQIVTGLTPGNTYYLRFYSASTSVQMTFNFCVQSTSPPSSDECANAINLSMDPFGATCTNPVTVTTTGATASTPATSCNSADAGDDVWYRFTAISTSAIIRVSGIVNTINNATTSVGFALYENACPATTTSLACEGNLGFGSGFKIINGLTIGNIYFVRVWTGGTNNYGSFSLCVQQVPAPPANDECAQATPLNINPYGFNCTTGTAVITTGATPSTPNTTCFPSDANDDVWFQFTATSASILVRITNATLTTSNVTASMGFSLHEAGCPIGVTSFTCDGNFVFGSGFKIVNGLTIGQSYYLRLWAGGINNYCTATLCVQEVPPAPANDQCSGAIMLNVNPYGSSCNASTPANTTGSTPSTPNATCTPTEANDDIWYQFMATSASIMVRISDAELTTTNSNNAGISFSLYEAGCPTGVSSFSCDANIAFGSGLKIVNGLTIGQLYYMRIWSTGSNNYASFNFCVQETPPPPANDDCSQATLISLNAFGTSCTATIPVNNAGATPSVFAPTCGTNDINDDLWYRFTASSASIIVRVFDAMLTTSTGSSSVGFALYSSGCPTNTTSLVCDGNIAFGTGYKIVDGLSIGAQYYLRIWLLGPNNYGTWNLCVQEVPPPPANNECVNATLITPGPPTSSCLSPVSANTSGATLSAFNPTCITTDSNNDDIWYRFTATTTTHKLLTTQLKNTITGASTSLGYAVYSSCPTTTASLTCAGNIGFSNASANITGLTIGTVYYLRLWIPTSNNYGSFQFCLLEVPQNNECTGAINLPVGNGFCINAVSGSLATATTSPGFGAPACQLSASSVDVWYKATVPATGNLIVQTSAAIPAVSDLVMEAYSGSCGGLNFIVCDDNGNPEPTPSANHARVTLTGRVPGEIIYYRVMPLTSGNAGEFIICAWDTSSSVLPPVASGGICRGAPDIDISQASQNRYRWVPIFDSSGHIIAEIYAEGISLNTVRSSVYVNGSGMVRNNNNKFFLDRNWFLHSDNIGNIRVRLYFKNTELTTLQAVDGTINTGNLQVLRSQDTCQGSYGSNPLFITTSYNSYGANHIAQIATNDLRSFYLESKCNTVIMWTGAVNTDWHNPANWDCGGVPWLFTQVIIPGGRVNYPIVSQNTEIKRLQLQTGATVTVNTGIELKINGN
jgi:large repetitive protein